MRCETARNHDRCDACTARRHARACLVLVGVLGCGGGSRSGSEYTEVGECEPPANATELATTPLSLFYDRGCFIATSELSVVSSDAEWSALFDCPLERPAEIDFAVERAAVVHVDCTPIDGRFVAESSDEIVVGIHTRVSGACLGNVLVVPVPRSTKPVLCALRPASDRAHYRAPKATADDMREQFAVAAYVPLPDFSMMPLGKLLELGKYATPPGTYFDAVPLHVLTTASLATMRSLADADFDVRRFARTS